MHSMHEPFAKSLDMVKLRGDSTRNYVIFSPTKLRRKACLTKLRNILLQCILSSVGLSSSLSACKYRLIADRLTWLHQPQDRPRAVFGKSETSIG